MAPLEEEEDDDDLEEKEEEDKEGDAEEDDLGPVCKPGQSRMLMAAMDRCFPTVDEDKLRLMSVKRALKASA